MLYSIWSHALLSDQSDTICCFTNEVEWNKIHDLNTGVKRIFAKISLNGKSVICPLGQPIRHALIDLEGMDSSAMFIPVWAVRTLNGSGVGDMATIEWCSEEYFPEATRVVLRPHDHTFYESDIKKELEFALTQYGVLELGSTIPIIIKALHNREYNFDIIALEPASVVLMEGDEVAIEFEKAFNAPVDTPKTTTSMPVDFDDAPMISIPVANDSGHVLGGVNVPPRPDGRRWNPWRNMGLRDKTIS